MEIAAKSIKYFARYNLAAKHWKPSEFSDHRAIKRYFTPKVTPGDFVDTLISLHAQTGLKCFGDAAEFLFKSNLTDVVAWNKNALIPNMDIFTDNHEINAKKMVQYFIEDGMSRRLALANTAANLQWPGNSFDAAVKSIERLCQDASRQKDRTTPASKCPKTTGK